MTPDRVVAALKPAALEDRSEAGVDAAIAAIVATPRSAPAARGTARRPLWPAVAGGVAVAAVAVTVVGVSTHRSGRPEATVVPAPPKASKVPNVQAAALSFTRTGRYLTVKVKDPVADPARYEEEFAAHGLNVDLQLAPTSPKKAGEVLFVEDDGGGRVKMITAPGHCGSDTCGVGIKIPLTYKAFVRVIFGRMPGPGEHYNTGPGDTPGEGVGLSNVRGRTVADVLAEARRKHIGDIGYRWQPTSAAEEGDKQPYPMGIPADKVKGDWRVYDAVAGVGGEVLLFVHPAG
ncbi:hypothetical protein [Actinoallomurus iriomotensis]|uniref:Uncharacterized protein n=1 Tax=Actinoallomurus iriomotensis TaxID=478107 RepID=A0A9W6VLZ6_9ACTN|nr:hypothetical protein [Actinoallomurus iriomotensis]GLY77033.1 hypothetical protein Airi01_053000 [Actinoallomurus iriomotensis]